MAVRCIQRAMGKNKVPVGMTYGTAYHTGDSEDWENEIAKDVGAVKIGSHEWFDIGYGWIIDCRHHVGSSSVPHARATANSRAALWARLSAETLHLRAPQAPEPQRSADRRRRMPPPLPALPRRRPQERSARRWA